MKGTEGRLVAGGQVTVSRSFGFSASHELRLLPAGHRCRRNHGHNYTVTATALVRDGAACDVSLLGDYLAATFDHRLINEQVAFNPTSELLAVHLGGWFRDHIESVMPITLVTMVVSETASTAARYDGVTGEVTISKIFPTGHGDVTVVLGADGLDEVGFITDFGDLLPFATHLLRAPAAEAGSLAAWFVGNVEPQIRARLVSLRVDSASTTGVWERGDAR